MIKFIPINTHVDLGMTVSSDNFFEFTTGKVSSITSEKQKFNVVKTNGSEDSKRSATHPDLEQTLYKREILIERSKYPKSKKEEIDDIRNHVSWRKKNVIRKVSILCSHYTATKQNAERRTKTEAQETRLVKFEECPSS